MPIFRRIYPDGLLMTALLMMLAGAITHGTLAYQSRRLEVTRISIEQLREKVADSYRQRGRIPPGVQSSAIRLIDINSANHEELQTLPGIGPARAGAIIEYRSRRGHFNTVDDLEEVPGIGPSIVKILRERAVALAVILEESPSTPLGTEVTTSPPAAASALDLAPTYPSIISTRATLAHELTPNAEALPNPIPTATPTPPLRYFIDVNSAGVEQLSLLPGIGPVKAQAIIDYRNQHGPYRRPEDLLPVRGIGPATLRNLIPHLVFHY